MADKVMGIKIRINSNDASKGLTRLKRDLAYARAEFKNTTAGAENWGKSVEGLTAKMSSLEKEISAYTNYLGQLAPEIEKVQTKYDQATAKLEEMSKAGKEGTEEFKKQQAVVSNLEIELKTLHKRYLDNESALKKAQAQSEKLTEEYNTLTSNLTLAEAELRKLTRTSVDASKDTKVLEKAVEVSTLKLEAQRKALDESNQQLKKLENSSEDTSDAIKVLKATILDQEAAVESTRSEIEKYNAALSQINQDKSQGIDALNTAVEENKLAFELAKEKCEDYTQNLDAMRTKTAYLNSELNLQKAQLESLESQLSDLTAEYIKNGGKVDENGLAIDDTSEAAQRFNARVKQLKTGIRDQRVELEKTTVQLDEQTQATKKLEKETTGMGLAFKFAKDYIEHTQKSSQLLNDGFNILKGTVTHLVAHSLTALMGTLKALLGNARELRKELGMLQATAETMGLDNTIISQVEVKDRVSWDNNGNKVKGEIVDMGQVDVAKNSLREIYKITEDITGGTEAVNNLLTSGFKGDGLNEITRQLLGASIQWKETLKMEGLADSIQEAIGSKGMSVTGQFAELIERIGLDIEVWKDKFSSLGSDAERQKMILDTLKNANDGEGTEKALTQYERINELLIEENGLLYDNLQTTAELSKVINPIMLQAKAGMNELYKTLTDWMESEVGIDTIRKTINDLFEKVNAGFKWVLENLNLVISVLGTIVAMRFSVTVAAGIGTIVSKVNELNNGMKILGGTFELTWSKMGKIGLIVGIIATVVAALVHAYNTNEQFRQSVNDFFNNLKPILETLGAALSDLFAKVGPLLIKLIESIMPVLIELLEALFPLIIDILNSVMPVIKDLLPILIELLQFLIPIIIEIADFLSAILIPLIKFVVDTIKTGVSGITSAIKTFVAYIDFVFSYWKALFQSIIAIFKGDTDKLKEIWSGVGEKFKSVWGELWKGLLNGLKDGWNNIYNLFKNLIDSLINWFKDKFGIHSPSKLFAGFGKNIMQGLIDGISNMFGKIQSTLSKIVEFFASLPNKIWSKIKDIGSKIASAFKTAVDKVKTIGGDIVKGLWNGINDKTTWVKNKITSFASKVGKSITDFFDINSPSKWAVDKGEYIGEGLGIGVVNSTRGVLNDIGKFNNKISDSFASNMNGTASGGGSQVINAGLTVNYNGTLSLKEIKKLENNYYRSIKGGWR